MSLSEYINEYLQEHDISLNELSRQCGISKGYMSMIMRGYNPSSGKPIVPSIKILKRLASGTSTTLNDLCACVDSYVSLKQDPIEEISSAKEDTAFAHVPSLSPEELDIIGAYRDLSEEGKDMVCGMLHVKRGSAGQEGQNMNAG